MMWNGCNTLIVLPLCIRVFRGVQQGISKCDVIFPFFLLDFGLLKILFPFSVMITLRTSMFQLPLVLVVLLVLS